MTTSQIIIISLTIISIVSMYCWYICNKLIKKQKEIIKLHEDNRKVNNELVEELKNYSKALETKLELSEDDDSFLVITYNLNVILNDLKTNNYIVNEHITSNIDKVLNILRNYKSLLNYFQKTLNNAKEIKNEEDFKILVDKCQSKVNQISEKLKE